MAVIGQLTGRITSMTIARVGYNISRELREKVEGDVTAQAIARYRAKAADYAKQFGYGGYTVREVNVSAGDMPGFMPSPMVRAKAMSAGADEALAVEPGKGSVSVTVSGTVQMTK
jgi:predicted secreted protein